MFNRTDPETHSRAVETPCSAHPEFWFAHSDVEQQAAADICWHDCPVREACLALANRLEAGSETHRHGVWGGYTAQQRIAEHRNSLRRKGGVRV